MSNWGTCPRTRCGKLLKLWRSPEPGKKGYYIYKAVCPEHGSRG